MTRARRGADNAPRPRARGDKQLELGANERLARDRSDAHASARGARTDRRDRCGDAAQARDR